MGSAIKMAEVEIPVNLAFVEDSDLEHAAARWTREQALEYHTLVKPEGAGLEDVAVFLYSILRGIDSKLSGTDEGVASDDVNESKQDGTNGSSDSDCGVSCFEVWNCGSWLWTD